MKIYLVRHGETEYSRKKYTSGHVDVPLNETGRTQAKHTTNFLREKGIVKIFTSSLSRAKETASIIGDALNLPIIECDEFREHTSGKLDGVPLSDFLDTLKKIGDFDEMVKQAGGEPLDVYQKRVWNKFTSIVRENANLDVLNILIVAHGGTSRSIFTEIMGYRAVKHVSQGNCCINIINYNNTPEESFSIELVNSTLHIT